MKFSNPRADVLVPDGVAPEEALARTTHLCIATHQDDTEIFAYHGIAACFGRKDRWFSNVTVTNGGGSARSGIYKDYTDEQMQDIRRAEQRKAAVLGEYSIQIQLAHPSSVVKDKTRREVVDDLVKILKAAKPKTVYLHNPADKHDTHVAVLIRSIEALRSLPDADLPENIYGCEVWRDLDWLMDSDKLPLPVSDYPNLSAALLGVFDSQISGGKRYDLAIAGRRVANATFLASHETDKETALTFTLDLTAFVKDRKASLADFVLSKIDTFRDDVKARIAKLS